MLRLLALRALSAHALHQTQQYLRGMTSVAWGLPKARISHIPIARFGWGPFATVRPVQPANLWCRSSMEEREFGCDACYLRLYESVRRRQNSGVER